MPAASTVSAGAYHTCAVTGSSVRCWGRNQGGRLGDGTELDRDTPTRIGLSSARAVAAGGYHSCAVTGVSVQCWGSNSRGQLGVGGQAGSLRPTPVPDL
jgi:alpha-tubulin suppressor-like RCC1 family protein